MVSMGQATTHAGAIILAVMSKIEASVQSPCVVNCCLDDALVCTGCSRSLEEIKEWGIADDRRRSVILLNAAQRKAAGPEGRSITPFPRT